MVENEAINEMVNQSSAVTDGAANISLLETLKDKVQPGAIVERIRLSQSVLIDIGLYAGIGFIIGFLFKRYFSYLITFALFVTGLILLQQLNFISLSINWTYVLELLHIKEVAADSLFPFLFEWIKSNMVIVISAVIGFLLGLKIG